MHLYLDLNASYLTAVLMGLFSSLHCIGMCGSIIGTLTFSLSSELRNNKARLFGIVFNYNLGRILSYGMAGVVVGLVESFLTMPFAEGQAHRVLQVVSALIMAGAGLYLAGWFPYFAYIEKTGVYFWKIVEPFGRKLIPVKTRTQALLFGMIWGWLPCGLIYTALALAASSGNIVHSGITMLAFGIGTLPAVMGVGIITPLLTRLSKAQRFKRFVGILFIAFALLAAFPSLNPMRVQHIMTF
ncbi:sulfite exporter TauE/SafE family protein [Methylomonas paludis]|uniref:Sulfite exporter TauE/SafE family protein n=1 Tax=Methylomonas paludis TaxID=1173101 RepID=A0A975MKP2_9GAMM|nr:sulfite exporter TauE/SafE family protein [Methylomonas paludis]QWF69562.1 sulfite exporter TauE/SafE family protein [Methylomonas paludis]